MVWRNAASKMPLAALGIPQDRPAPGSTVADHESARRKEMQASETEDAVGS